MAGGTRVVKDRIFISEVIREKKIVQQWEDLCGYVNLTQEPRTSDQQGGMPTMEGYGLKVAELQELLIKVSRDDLGLRNLP
jgi:hypothetical protein